RTVARRLSAPPPARSRTPRVRREGLFSLPSTAPLYPSSGYPTRPLPLGPLSCSTFPPRLLLTGDPSENLRCLATDLGVWCRPSSPAPRSGIPIPEVRGRRLPSRFLLFEWFRQTRELLLCALWFFIEAGSIVDFWGSRSLVGACLVLFWTIGCEEIW
uniref:Uncharacterized protein n=1 Tax=Aegilops tauschii subsp. strangulata TaxID=200361 RepID=A0A453EP09_AEGTS